MMHCEGYMMAHGTATITPPIRPDGTRWKEPFELTGTWLYRPDNGCWYCKPDGGGMTQSWAPDLVGEIKEA